MSALEIRIDVLAGAPTFPFAGAHRIVRESDLLVEPVHVQLTDKRCVVVVLKKLQDQDFCELILVQHDKRVAVIRPSDQIGVLGLIQETAQLLYERRNLFPLHLRFPFGDQRSLIQFTETLGPAAFPGKTSMVREAGRRQLVPTAPAHHLARCLSDNLGRRCGRGRGDILVHCEGGWAVRWRIREGQGIDSVDGLVLAPV